jgi:hypothetical protein
MSADLDVVVPRSDVRVLQFRFNQLSIVIRHRSVKSILRGILFEASVPQVLLHAVRKSYNQRTRLFFAEREKGGQGK